MFEVARVIGRGVFHVSAKTHNIRRGDRKSLRPYSFIPLSREFISLWGYPTQDGHTVRPQGLRTRIEKWLLTSLQQLPHKSSTSTAIGCGAEVPRQLPVPALHAFFRQTMNYSGHLSPRQPQLAPCR